MNKGIEIRITNSGLHPRSNLVVFVEQFKDNKYYVARTLEMIEDKRELYEPTIPILSISNTAAQQLMDDLWMCGLRPSEGSGSAGALLAVQRHLEDMRTLFFAKLNVIKPGENK